MYNYLKEQSEHFQRVSQVLRDLGEQMEYKLTGVMSPNMRHEHSKQMRLHFQQEEEDEFERSINHGLTFKECSDLARELLKLYKEEEDEDELPIDRAAKAMEMDELSKKLHVDWSKVKL